MIDLRKLELSEVLFRCQEKGTRVQVNDSVFLKVSHMKWVMRFNKKGKMSPRYVDPYKILKRVGKVDYELE